MTGYCEECGRTLPKRIFTDDDSLSVRLHEKLGEVNKAINLARKEGLIVTASMSTQGASPAFSVEVLRRIREY